MEPRDIIVMCPDIENFAPLIQATFGGQELDGVGGGSPTARSRSGWPTARLRQTNPVMGVLAEVLELASARITATEVLDLAGRDPVRRRFRFSDDDLSRLEEWVDEAFVRWGFDADHRSAFQLEGIEANTWQAGLDRILLGVTMADERQRLFDGALPLDDVDSGDIDLAGRLSEFVDRLRRALDALAGYRPVDGWATTLADISDSLTCHVARDVWQRAQLTTLLDELVAEATAEDGVSARRPELRRCSVDPGGTPEGPAHPGQFLYRPSHRLHAWCPCAPFRTGWCAFSGLDDGSFPRHIERDGDDLTARNPRVGRPRRPQRRPSAPSRRAAGGARPPRHDLHRA